MTEPSLTPADVEAIAAFLDRQLSDEERAAFLERLDQDEALYEVFVETVRCREAASDPGGVVVTHPSAAWGPKRWAAAGALAAALAAAVVVPAIYRGRPLTAARLGSSLAKAAEPAALGERWTEQRWSTTRSDAPVAGKRGTAFRLGVRLVELDLALRLGLAEEATRLTHQIENLLQGVELSEALGESYGEVRRRLGEDPTLNSALALSERAESLVARELEAEDLAFDFGKWAEAGRLAARTGNRSLLASGQFRRALEGLREHTWDAAVDAGLEELARLLPAEAEELDLVGLERAFVAIINQS